MNLDALTAEFAALRALAGDAMMEEACGLLRERLKLTPEKLMLMMLRKVAPEEIVGQGEEATLRGTKADTLRDAKNRGEFAREISGLQIPVKSQNG